MVEAYVVMQEPIIFVEHLFQLMESSWIPMLERRCDIEVFENS